MVRIYFDRTRNPVRNMARENELFRRVEKGELPETIRFWKNSECLVRGKARNPRYGWYHEELAERFGVIVVQRETGGGVVYNDQGNLNWSFISRRSGPLLTPTTLFGQASEYVVGALNRLGIKAQFAPPNRIDVSGHKVSGLAARSSPRTLLVHGTLLIHSNLEKLNTLCIPPPDCPPVANLQHWVPRIEAKDVVSALLEVLKESGLDVQA